MPFFESAAPVLFCVMVACKLKLVVYGDHVNVQHGASVMCDTEAANIVLPFGAGVEVQVYVFFKNEENGTFSVRKHSVVNVT